MNKPSESACQAAPAHWQRFDLSDVRECTSIIDAIETADVESIARATLLFLLCGGSQATLVDRIEIVTSGICDAVIAKPAVYASVERAEAWRSRLRASIAGLSLLPSTFDATIVRDIANSNLERCDRAIALSIAAILQSRRRGPPA